MTRKMICNTDLDNKNLHIENGERWEKNSRNFESEWFKRISKFSTMSTIEMPVVTIPVVVHVVYNEKKENISDSQIQSQIDVLNREFRMQNNNLNKVPDAWKHLVGDARVEFMLAAQDPEGKPTSGITRTKTKVKKFIHGEDMNNRPLPQKIKFSHMGGKDAWDTSRYLNIWVCNLDSAPRQGTIGYAQFPDRPPLTDGIVMRFDAFGTGPGVKPPLHLGKVTVHECGHYLGLYHIWGDISDFPGNECENAGDNIEDTPNQKLPNSQDPTFPSFEQACDDTGRNGTMFMNHMDYTSDETRCMFTLGQIARIRYTLETSRRTMLQNGVLRSQHEETGFSDLRRLPAKVYDGVGSRVKIEELL